MQFSKSTFISTLTRDKRSVLTRCARVTSRPESFPISRNFSLFFDSSSEKRGKGIEEVEPRDPAAHTLDSRGYFIGKVWRRRVTRRILPENTILHSKDRRTRCIAFLDCRQLWYTDEWKGNAGRQAKTASKIRARKILDSAKQLDSLLFPRIRTIFIRDPFNESRFSSRKSVQFRRVDTSRFICTKQRTFPRLWGERILA